MRRNSDADLRRLERQAEITGDAMDQARLLTARVRSGALDPWLLRAAVTFEHEAAVLTGYQPFTDFQDDEDSFREGWGIFEADRGLEIQAVHEPPEDAVRTFTGENRDADAHAFVREQALLGNHTAINALLAIRQQPFATQESLQDLDSDAPNFERPLVVLGDYLPRILGSLDYDIQDYWARRISPAMFKASHEAAGIVEKSIADSFLGLPQRERGDVEGPFFAFDRRAEQRRLEERAKEGGALEIHRFLMAARGDRALFSRGMNILDRKIAERREGRQRTLDLDDVFVWGSETYDELWPNEGDAETFGSGRPRPRPRPRAENPPTRRRNMYRANLVCSHCGDITAALTQEAFDRAVGGSCNEPIRCGGRVIGGVGDKKGTCERCGKKSYWTKCDRRVGSCPGVYLDTRGQAGVPMAFPPRLDPEEASLLMIETDRVVRGERPRMPPTSLQNPRRNSDADLRALERAVLAQPGDRDLAQRLARAYQRAGREQEARVAKRLASGELDPRVASVIASFPSGVADRLPEAESLLSALRSMVAPFSAGEKPASDTFSDEGWGIFEARGYDGPLLQIQPIWDDEELIRAYRDETGTREDADAIGNDAAWWRVREKAYAGSPRHLAVLAFLLEASPEEYQNVLRGWSYRTSQADRSWIEWGLRELSLLRSVILGDPVDPEDVVPRSFECSKCGRHGLPSGESCGECEEPFCAHCEGITHPGYHQCEGEEETEGNPRDDDGVEPSCPDCEVFIDGLWRTGVCDECKHILRRGEVDPGCQNCLGTGHPVCCRCEGTGVDPETRSNPGKKQRFVVRSIRQGLDLIRHPAIRKNFDKALKWRPKNKLAVLVPCAGTKPFPEAPSHRDGYLAALDGKKADLWVVSEPLGVVPYDWSRTWPNDAYDYPPKYLRDEAWDELAERVALWLKKVAPKYKKVFVALPGHHERLIRAALEIYNPGNLKDSTHSQCLSSGACPSGHGRSSSKKYRRYLSAVVRNPDRRNP